MRISVWSQDPNDRTLRVIKPRQGLMVVLRMWDHHPDLYDLVNVLPDDTEDEID